MKILITGYTTRMTGSKWVSMDYITFSTLLEEILKDMGHEVERRKVLIGEELNHVYDFAFCGVAPLSSMTSSRVCETHYAMDSMVGRCVTYADDWSFCGYGDSVRYTLGRWEQYLNYKRFPYSNSVIEQTRQSLELMMRVDELYNAPVLAPMFPWGNHRFLMTGSKGDGNYKAKLITVDPSAWVEFPNVDIPKPSQRTRQWVMAALADHTPWIKKQHLRLPIVYIGNKRMEGVRVLNETDTVRLFSNSFGVLSVGYPSAGSGWWRTRYLNAAWAETLIYSDPRDAATMGEAFRGSADEFESIITDNEYLQRVEAQANWLYGNISDKSTVQHTLERLMKK